MGIIVLADIVASYYRTSGALVRVSP